MTGKNGELGELVQKINIETHGKLAEFLLHYNLCPDCGIGKLERHDPDIVCVNCGFVVENENYSTQIPFGTENSPGNPLHEGKGLGGTLQERGTWCLLAKQQGIEDLPIRARHTTIMMSRNEHPRLASLLKFGAKRTREFGIPPTPAKPKDIMINHIYGDMLRSIGALYVVKGWKFHNEVIADPCFALTVKIVLGDTAFEKVKADLHIEDSRLGQIQLLHSVVKID